MPESTLSLSSTHQSTAYHDVLEATQPVEGRTFRVRLAGPSPLQPPPPPPLQQQQLTAAYTNIIPETKSHGLATNVSYKDHKWMGELEWASDAYSLLHDFKLQDEKQTRPQPQYVELHQPQQQQQQHYKYQHKENEQLQERSPPILYEPEQRLHEGHNGDVEQKEPLSYRRVKSSSLHRERVAVLRAVSEEADATATALARRSFEQTIRAREKELAEVHEALQHERARVAATLQREEDLRSRLIVAEETRVLYQLHLQRLLDTLRATGRTSTLNTSSPSLNDALQTMSTPTTATSSFRGVSDAELSAAVLEALRSADAATDGATGPRPLANATRLLSSMLTTKVTECLAKSEEAVRRRQTAIAAQLQTAAAAVVEEMDGRHTAVLAAVRRAERRIHEFARIVSSSAQIVCGATKKRDERVVELQTEVARLKEENGTVSRQLQVAQADVSALRDELSRAESERATAIVVHRAAEYLDEVKQSVKQCVQSATRDWEQRALECNTLNEPFLQSIRLIVMKVEGQAQLAREAIQREARGGHPHALYEQPPITPVQPNKSFSSGGGLYGTGNYEEMQRRILSPPCRTTSRGPPLTGHDTDTFSTQGSMIGMQDTVFGGSNGIARVMLMLEELSRIVANLSRLLDNNARQMTSNTTAVTRAISSWEASVVQRMASIEELMSGALSAGGLLTSRPPHPTPSLEGWTAADASPPALIAIAQKLSHPSGSGGASHVSSVEASRATSTARPRGATHQTQWLHKQPDPMMGQMSPPSIAVSIAATPLRGTSPRSAFSPGCAASTVPRPPAQHTVQEAQRQRQLVVREAEERVGSSAILPRRRHDAV